MRLIIEDEKPSSHLNLECLTKYSNGDVFVETGTYMGDTVRLAKDFGFKTIHSIELDDNLFDRAVNLFKSDPSIHIWHGDSIDALIEIMKHLDAPATFWLDAHASGPLPGGKSGGSPVVDELNIIKAHHIKEHTIFIDDRRLFESAEWSYVKEEDAMRVLTEINPDYKIYLLDGHIEADVICATVK